MMRHARLGLLLATLAGIAIAIWAVVATGAREVLAAVASIGPLGFLVLIGWTGINLCVMGAAWLAVAPGIARHQLRIFAWARTTREAATDVLPFAQFGGLLVGARTAISGGIRDSLVYASLVADQTMELAAQLVFSLFGIAMLLLVLSHSSVTSNILPLALGGTALMAAIMLAFAFGQKPLLRMAEGLAGRLLPESVATMSAMRGELDAIYRQRGRVITAFLLHLAAWIFSAAGAWIALRFMDVPVSLTTMLTIEALIFTLRTVAFAIPGGVGVQEGAYVLLGPLFGVPPTAALALSLIKRARDLAIGIPAILVWQAQEVRGLRSQSRSPAKAGVQSHEG